MLGPVIVESDVFEQLACVEHAEELAKHVRLKISCHELSLKSLFHHMSTNFHVGVSVYSVVDN